MSAPTAPPQSGDYRDAKAQAKAAKAYAKAQRPWFKKKRFILLIAVGLIASIYAMTSGGGDSTDATTRSSDTSNTAPEAVEEEAAPVEEELQAEEKPEYTTSQENAIESAKGYLEYTPFSRVGLIQQLSSKAGEGYPKADAVFAVNHIEVDWNQQAAKAAKGYLEYSSFSRAGLIQQLESKAGDGYTHAQAVYGVSKTGL